MWEDTERRGGEERSGGREKREEKIFLDLLELL